MHRYLAQYDHWPDPVTLGFIAAAGTTAATGGAAAGAAAGGAAAAATGAGIGAFGIAALGIGAAGVGLAALGQIRAGQVQAVQARSQAAIADFNARVQARQASAQEAAATFAQQRQSREAARIQSALRAGLGASGVVISTGTPLMLQAAQAEESELENILIGFQGRVGAGQARSQAQLDRLQAKIFRRAGGARRQAGRIGAGSILLSGFGGLALQGAAFG